MKLERDYLDWWTFAPLRSLNAMVYFITGARGIGKTTGMKVDVIKRFLNTGEKFLWLRKYGGDVDACKIDFIGSTILKLCDLTSEQIVQEGVRIYFKEGKHKTLMGEIHALSQSQRYKGCSWADQCGTIVFDEFQSTQSKNRYYRGDMAVDLANWFTTMDRGKPVKMVLLGNKEMYDNPFYSFFNIVPPSLEFQGIRRYQGGMVVLEQINDKPLAFGEHQSRLLKLFGGTRYEGYITGIEVSGLDQTSIRYFKPTSEHKVLASFDLGGAMCTLWVNRFNSRSSIHVTTGVWKDGKVFTDRMTDYPKQRVIQLTDVDEFVPIYNRFAKSEIYYANVGAKEQFTIILQVLGLAPK